MNRTHLRRQLLTLLAAAGLALSVSVHAAGPDNPTKPVRLVVGFAAGTSLDVVARTVARKLEETWTAGVIVDNRAGAGGALAVSNVGTSAPDGTTLLLASVGEVSIAPHLYRKLPFDPVRLVPVAEIVTGDVAFVVGSQVPVKNMEEFLQWSRDKSPTMIGTFGPGTPHHLVSAMLAETTQRKVEPVHYRAVADALNGLVMGELQGAFVSTALANAWIQAGKAKVLAVSASVRSPLFPNVPTMRESKLEGAEFTGWIGIYAPPGTPNEAADKMNAAIVAAVRSPAVKAAMEQIGYVVTGESRVALTQRTAADRVKYGKLTDSLGLKLD